MLKESFNNFSTSSNEENPQEDLRPNVTPREKEPEQGPRSMTDLFDKNFMNNLAVTRFQGIEHIEHNEILEQAHNLREKVFIDELEWVSKDKNKKGEQDKYDACSVHFVAFQEPQKGNKEIMGYLRLIPPGNLFMLDDEFRGLLSDSDFNTLNLKRQESVEISRLALPQKLRESRISFSLNMTLYREMYRWCLENKVEYIYIVSTHKLLKFLQRFFSCTIIGTPTRHQKEHEESMAAVINIKDSKNKLNKSDPKLLQWFLGERLNKNSLL